MCCGSNDTFIPTALDLKPYLLDSPIQFELEHSRHQLSNRITSVVERCQLPNMLYRIASSYCTGTLGHGASHVLLVNSGSPAQTPVFQTACQLLFIRLTINDRSAWAPFSILFRRNEVWYITSDLGDNAF